MQRVPETGAAGPDPVDERIRLLLAGIVRTVAGIDAAGVVELCPDGRARSRVASDPRGHLLDGDQADRDDGPSLDALRGDGATAVVVPDVAAEGGRRPELAAAAAEAGVASLIAVPFAAPGAPAATVTFYGAAARAFDDPAAHELATALAREVATELFGAHRSVALRRTHAPSDLLGRAKGIVMERFALDDAGAFALLLREAREAGEDLLDLACRLADDAAETPAVRPTALTPRGAGRRGDGHPGRHDRRDHLERREALEDEREGLAHHRDRLAEARETLADDREALADAREHQADRRDAALADREATMGQLAGRIGFGHADRLGRADEVLGRSYAAVERMGENVTRSRAALTRVRELYAREQEEIDRETLDSARSAAESGDDPADPSGRQVGRIGPVAGAGPPA